MLNSTNASTSGELNETQQAFEKLNIENQHGQQEVQRLQATVEAHEQQIDLLKQSENEKTQRIFDLEKQIVALELTKKEHAARIEKLTSSESSLQENLNNEQSQNQTLKLENIKL